MESTTPNENNINATVNAVKGLVEAVPIYQDAIQPAAQEVGKSLVTVAKLVNIVLAPVSALVWGYDKISDFVSLKVAEKLADIPKEKIITPAPEVVGPAIEALKFAGYNEHLRGLYANLIATAMIDDEAHKAHPGFVEVLKNLCPDEAILLKAFHEKDTHAMIHIQALISESDTFFYKKRNVCLLGEKLKLYKQDMVPSYIDNLCRLGLIEVPYGIYLAKDEPYIEIEESNYATEIKKHIEDEDKGEAKFE